MNKKVLIIIIAVVTIGLIIGAAFLYDALSADITPSRLNEKSDAEYLDFTVEDKEGNKVKLSDFEGKAVVLNFWASWCGPCKSEMPAFNSAYMEYGDEIEFVMVNMTDGYQETKEAATKFIESTGYSFPIYYDTESEAAFTYEVYSIPQTFFIDEKGKIIAQAQGAISRDTLQEGIDLIYKKD